MTVHTYPKAKNFSADFYLSRYTKEDASRRSFLSPPVTAFPLPAAVKALGKHSEWRQLLPIPTEDASPKGVQQGAPQGEARAKVEGCLTPTDPKGQTSTCSLSNCL